MYYLTTNQLPRFPLITFISSIPMHALLSYCYLLTELQPSLEDYSQVMEVVTLGITLLSYFPPQRWLLGKNQSVAQRPLMKQLLKP